jgi:hypothetical protein
MNMAQPRGLLNKGGFRDLIAKSRFDVTNCSSLEAAADAELAYHAKRRSRTAELKCYER